MNERYEYHTPVLSSTVCDMLIRNRNGVYLDGTLGGGGHFNALGSVLERGAVLIGIDRDLDAVKFNLERNHHPKVKLVFEQSRFSEMESVCAKHSITKVDGILLDLGVSSFQIDTPRRGFSYMKECELDMRMDSSTGRTAYDLIEESTTDELAEVLEKYGEIRNAARMAKAIKSGLQPLRTSMELKGRLRGEYGRELKYAILAKVYMALRIAVNEELIELEKALDCGVRLLSIGGRIAVISYHSLEDRIVKDFFKSKEPHCICTSTSLMCCCGLPGQLKRITRKPVIASGDEVEANQRSRSARLRVAEKIRDCV